MTQPKKAKVYVAGKISGLPLDVAKENFRKGCLEIEKQGLIPVNPFDSGLPDSAPYESHIAVDLRMMYLCDGVAVLPNWYQSKGAINEVKEALERGMMVVHLDVDISE